MYSREWTNTMQAWPGAPSFEKVRAEFHSTLKGRTAPARAHLQHRWVNRVNTTKPRNIFGIVSPPQPPEQKPNSGGLHQTNTVPNIKAITVNRNNPSLSTPQAASESTVTNRNKTLQRWNLISLDFEVHYQQLGYQCPELKQIHPVWLDSTARFLEDIPVLPGAVSKGFSSTSLLWGVPGARAPLAGLNWADSGGKNEWSVYINNSQTGLCKFFLFPHLYHNVST